MKNNRKVIELGKIDFYGTGKKINAVDVEIELRSTNKGPELSICGSIWNSRHTDIVCGGQCLDEIAEYIHSAKFKEIYRLWKNYHLNGMHAGTVRQEAYLKEHRKTEPYKDYTRDCEILKEAGLYEDEQENGYKYGHSWLYRKIPEEDLRKINEILE